MNNLIVYGPPGSGKSVIGELVARRLGRPFVDGDAWIEARWGRPVAAYFEAGDETLFRAREAAACQEWSDLEGQVIAPGGGALLDPHSRARLEAAGVIVCLEAQPEVLVERLRRSHQRPLLAGEPEARLRDLLRERAGLYTSFAARVVTDGLAPEAVAAEVERLFTANPAEVRLTVGGRPALYGHGLLSRLPARLPEAGLRRSWIIVSDENVARLHGDGVRQRLAAPLLAFPAGEAHKNLDTVRGLYSACLAAGLERTGALLALGGGVTGDLAGFVAATLLRGVPWVNLPTTVLAMADAGLGGKVGVDLPEGKNLAGAFHWPELVAADFDVLMTLPEAEIRNGLAEVLKSAVIGDRPLFHWCVRGGALQDPAGLAWAITRAAAVKAGIVNADPDERGERAKLNLGHTIGHAIELASGFRLRHGEAVAIGLAAEARLAQRLGLAGGVLVDEVTAAARALGLPTAARGLDPAGVRAAMQRDKKRSRGRLRFALPRAVGDVIVGQEADEAAILRSLEEALNGVH